MEQATVNRAQMREMRFRRKGKGSENKYSAKYAARRKALRKKYGRD